MQDVSLIARTPDDTCLVHVVAREGPPSIVVVSRYVQVVFLRKGRTVDFVLPVGAPHHRLVAILIFTQPRIQEVFRGGIIGARTGNDLPVRFTVLPDSFVRESAAYLPVVDSRIEFLFVDVLRISIRIQDIYLLQHCGHSEVGGELYLAPSFMAFFRRNQHHAVGTTRAVDRRGGSVLQNLDRLDVMRVDGRKRVHVHLAAVGGLARWRGCRLERDAIDDVKRLRAGRERIGTAHVDADGAARRTVRLVDGHAGELALQCLVEAVGAGTVHQFVTADFGHCSRQVALLHRTVSDDDDLVHVLCTLFQDDIERRAVAHLYLLAQHTHAGNVQDVFGSCLDGIVAVDIGNAGDLVLDFDDSSDHGFVLCVQYLSRDLTALCEACQGQEAQHH